MSASGTAVEAGGGSGTGSSRPAVSRVRKAVGSAL